MSHGQNGAEANQTVNTVRTFSLPAKSEFRFELGAEQSLAVCLNTGDAETMGTSFTRGQWYTFGHEAAVCIYTWNGASLSLLGDLAAVEYQSSKSNMPEIAALHLALEQRRLAARESGSNGPRLMIIGGPDACGRSTVIKTLAALATTRSASHWTPIIIDTDPGQGAMICPGLLSITPLPAFSILRTCSSIAPWGAQSATTAGSSTAPLQPANFWFGHTDIAQNPTLYANQITTVAKTLDKKLQSVKKDDGKLSFLDEGSEDLDVRAMRASGVLIDTPAALAYPLMKGYKDEETKEAKTERYGMIRHLIESLRVDIVVIVGSEKILVEMRKLTATMSRPPVTLNLSRGAGVVDVDQSTKKNLIAQRIKAYFYGTPHIKLPENVSNQSLFQELSPVNLPLPVDVLSVFKIGQDADYIAPTSALPIGAMATRSLAEIRVEKLDLTESAMISRLTSSVLAVVKPIKIAEDEEGEDIYQDLLQSEVLGLVHVQDVEQGGKRLNVLRPSAGKLPSLTLVAGSIDWTDED